MPTSAATDGSCDTWTSYWDIIIISEDLKADGYDWASGVNYFSHAQSGGNGYFYLGW